MVKSIEKEGCKVLQRYVNIGGNMFRPRVYGRSKKEKGNILDATPWVKVCFGDETVRKGNIEPLALRHRIM